MCSNKNGDVRRKSEPSSVDIRNSLIQQILPNVNITLHARRFQFCLSYIEFMSSQIQSLKQFKGAESEGIHE